MLLMAELRRYVHAAKHVAIVLLLTNPVSLDIITSGLCIIVFQAEQIAAVAKCIFIELTGDIAPTSIWHRFVSKQSASSADAE